MAIVKTKNSIVSILDTRHLTESTYVIRIERNGMEFEAGQYISLGLPGNYDKREYSIYSGIQDDFLEVLVKEIDEGIVSKQLKLMQPGAKVELDGPFGFFTLGTESRKERKVIFIASGTGIAPFHSFITSYPELNYSLLHGVKFKKEAYEHEKYDSERYILCASRDEQGDFNGRVSDYLRENQADTNADYYLCGNSNMIHDVYDLLKEKGIEAGRIHAEVYF